MIWSGKGAAGDFASIRFPAPPVKFAWMGLIALSNAASTNGVRSSSECAMLVQSLSRSNMLRR